MSFLLGELLLPTLLGGNILKLLLLLVVLQDALLESLHLLLRVRGHGPDGGQCMLAGNHLDI